MGRCWKRSLETVFHCNFGRQFNFKLLYFKMQLNIEIVKVLDETVGNQSEIRKKIVHYFLMISFSHVLAN